VGGVQYNWFIERLALATACWKIVMFHHPPYTSCFTHSPSTTMAAWGFDNLGIDLVLSGHCHQYERIVKTRSAYVPHASEDFASAATITYVINGTAGTSLYGFNDIPDADSVIRNNTVHGALLIDASCNKLTGNFMSSAGVIIDTFELTKTP